MKPMLAAKTNGKNIRYPALASPKLDGVRALVLEGRVYSRSLKLIPNLFVQATFGHAKFNGLDGELIVGEPTAADCFRTTTSGVMSVEGRPDVLFHVFDDFSHDGPFRERLASVQKRATRGSRIVPVHHMEVTDEDCLRFAEESWLAAGYEGAMLRDPAGPYKQGRSTEREGWLLKLKRFEDSEALVLGCVEQMHNGNAATTDELGHTKRSSHKANKTGKGTLGALHVRDLKTRVEFDIGTGMDDALRAKLWAAHVNAGPTVGKRGRAEPVVGRIVKYKFFPTGSKEKPRFPVFLGFRDARDM